MFRTGSVVWLVGRQRLLLAMFMMALLPGCLGTVVGTAVDVTIEVVKVPFKVAAAIVDVVTDDEEDK